MQQLSGRKDPLRQVKSRREMYSEATRAALLDDATALFAGRGYAATSLEDVASASRVTRGAVYHHFASKQALFEAVLDAQEERATAVITAAASDVAATSPWEAAMLALDAFLRHCCDPDYGRLVWLEGPSALGWHRWRECEQKHAYGLVEGYIQALVEAGHLDGKAMDTLVRFCFWMLGGAGLALAETADAGKERVREEWGSLIRRSFAALRVG
jgi:AcrR family transcriptional regulator